jgi:hypothetical protein
MKSQRLLFITLALIILVLGIGGAGLVSSAPNTEALRQVSSPTPAGPTATPLPDMIGPTFAENVNPLTGQVVADPSVLNRRPIAVKVSNAPAVVRPQAGLSYADIVFEHYLEASLTRYTAIFYGNTVDRVGSVRSARLIDLQIPRMYQAILAYAGASGPVRERILASAFADRALEGVSVGQPRFFRDPLIQVPNNLFANPAEIWERAERDGVNVRPVLEGMTFVAEPPADFDGTTNDITINYGPDVVKWHYDAATGLYQRFVDDELHTDALDGTPITAANVVILGIHHVTDYTIIEHEVGDARNYSVEIQIWTLGPATIFRDGVRYEGRWHRWADDVMLTFWRDDTMVELMYLKPGNTWMQVVPLDFQGVTLE